MRILIVDDEPEICNFLQEFLAKKNYEVLTATDSMKALEVIQSVKPNLVLLDIRMPERDGVSLLQEIKSLNEEIGVIMVTAVREETLAKRTMALGADGYITKPIDLDYLEANILVKRILDAPGLSS